MNTHPPLVLTIQSHVAWGHVGNAAAMLPLQLSGVEAVAVHTVQFSNHTGFGEVKGQVFSAEHIRDVIEGLQARDVLANCSAVLSGYLGDVSIGHIILDAVRKIRKANPAVRYLCDPVMGDVHRGIFVRPGIPPFLRQYAMPQADILTPNQYEFELLSDTSLRDLPHAIAEARRLLRSGQGQPGPDTIIITSLLTPDMEGRLGTLAVRRDDAWLVTTPIISLDPMPSGMGDVFSSTLLARLLVGDALPQALGHAVSTLYGLIAELPSGSRNLPLVQARQQIVQPTRLFDATKVA